MSRLVALLSACSAFLAAAWLLTGTRDADQRFSPKLQQPHARSQLEVPATRAHRESHRAALLDSKDAIEKQKKKKVSRGVVVDRHNIVENVTLDDLQAPPGRLWTPAAVAGPVLSYGGNRLRNVLVAYCQLDMAAYHAEPWLFAMGTFHQRQSGCLDDKSLTRTYRLSALMDLVDQHPEAFMDPSGFIYHETRCGSTLTANMIASIPSNIVHSETPPPVVVLNICGSKCGPELKRKVIRTMYRLMGPAQQGHTNTFFKFQSSKFVNDVEDAWPDVKWIYLFRDPLEVISSNLKGAWRKTSVNTRASKDEVPEYNLGGPCVRAVTKPASRGKRATPPSPNLLVSACVKQLELLNTIALDKLKNGSPNGLAVEYRQLPEVISEYVYPTHFAMAHSDEDRQQSIRHMEPVTHIYSKGMSTVQDGAVSKNYTQGMDLELKENGSDELMRTAASGMCETYRSLVALQRWHKEEEGGTIGTCNR